MTEEELIGMVTDVLSAWICGDEDVCINVMNQYTIEDLQDMVSELEYVIHLCRSLD